jgi:adenylate cyclase
MIVINNYIFLHKYVDHDFYMIFSQWCKWENINPLFLTFSQRNWEIPYLREPDPLFKFYIACVTIVLIFSGFILLIPIASINNRR